MTAKIAICRSKNVYSLPALRIPYAKQLLINSFYSPPPHGKHAKCLLFWNGRLAGRSEKEGGDISKTLLLARNAPNPINLLVNQRAITCIGTRLPNFHELTQMLRSAAAEQ